jgi:hypothetical protein
MTPTESLLFEQLKATTLALRIALGHVESQYMATARALDATVIASEHYRKLSGEQRAAIADAGTAIIEAAAAVKGLKHR